MTSTTRTILTLASLILATASVLPVASTAAVEREVVPNTSPSNKLRTSPPRIELDVDPGSRVTAQISVLNDSETAQDVSVIPSDFGPSSNPRSIGNRVEDAEFGAGDWITPELADFRLEPFERISFDIVIETPTDAPRGTNLAAVAIRGTPASGAVGASDAGGAVVVDALVQVFLTVAGTVEHDLEITDVKTRDALLLGSNRLVVWDITFENNGTVNEHVEGRVDVRSIFGNRADRLKVEPLIVLRGSTRTLRVIWRDVPWVGAFHPEVHVRGDDARPLQRSGSRTVLLPWWVIPAILLSVAAPTVWIWLQRRRSWEEYVDEDDGEDWYDEPPLQ